MESFWALLKRGYHDFTESYIWGATLTSSGEAQPEAADTVQIQGSGG